MKDRSLERLEVSVGIGVFWYAWSKVGFWWEILYGLFWPTWLGFVIAKRLGLGA